MIQIDPYDPSSQDLFLYEDHTISWTVPTAGSLVVKRPYAWNPNCVLYGYRRSLEGICAPYRTFSTAFTPNPNTAPAGSDAYQCNQVNPYNDVANKPIWFNSFPPTHCMISKRHLLTCAHCFGIAGTDRPAVSALTFADLYAAGSYLNAVTVLRFIDGWNNPIELSKTQYEYPYEYDSANGFPPNGASPQKTVSAAYRNDCAISVGSSDFQYNPITCIDAGSVTAGSEWHYLNAGNLTVQRATIRATGGFFTTPHWAATTYGGVQALHASQYDRVFLHDSGSLFLYPIKAPTSVQAGDGIMGVAAGHVYSAFPDWSVTQEWEYGDPPRKDPAFPAAQLRPYYQPALVNRNDAVWTAFQSYWTNLRGHPYPSLVNARMPSGTQLASASQINNLNTTVAAMLGGVTP